MAELKIKADSGGGTVSLKGPSTTTSNAAVQLTLPVDDGTANQVLKTDGNGALSWAAGGTPGISSSSTGDVITIDASHHVMFRDITSNVDTRNVSGITIKSPHGITIRNYGANGSRNWRIRPDDLGGWADLDFSCAPTDGSSDIPDVAADNVLSLQGDTKDVVVANGNLIVATSGKGIDFSATSDGSGTDSSELLDDYEEGSFTSTWTGYTTAATTTATSTSYYTKVGNQVTCYINLANATIAGGGGPIKMEGLPYATSSNSDGGQTCSTLLTYKVDFDTDRNQTFYTWQSVSFIIGYQSRSGNTWTAWDISDWHDGNRYCQFTFTYRTD